MKTSQEINEELWNKYMDNMRKGLEKAIEDGDIEWETDYELVTADKCWFL